MAKGILIGGESGTGKSASVEGLDPKETFIIKVTDKELPFRGSDKNYVLLSKDAPNGNVIIADKANDIIKTLNYISQQRLEIKTVVLDD